MPKISLKTAIMRNGLELLVKSFDDDEGLPNRAYLGTFELIRVLMSEKAAEIFWKAINCQDSRYYLSKGCADDVWINMKKAK